MNHPICCYEAIIKRSFTWRAESVAVVDMIQYYVLSFATFLQVLLSFCMTAACVIVCNLSCVGLVNVLLLDKSPVLFCSLSSSCVI